MLTLILKFLIQSRAVIAVMFVLWVGAVAEKKKEKKTNKQEVCQ